MKIKAKVKLEWDTLYEHKLILHVHFRYPRALLKTKLRKTVASSWWIGNDKSDSYKNRKEFNDVVIAYLSDKNFIEMDVVNMITNHYKKKTKTTNNDLFQQQVLSLIKGFGKDFEIEVEIDDKKSQN